MDPQVVISFSILGIQAVPLSPWLSGLIALLLALVAIVYIRRAKGIAASMFMAALAFVTGSIVLQDEVVADSVSTLLSVSPTIKTMVETDFSGSCRDSVPTATYTFERNVSPAIKLDNVTIVVTPADAFRISDASTCIPGLTLTPDQTCTVVVEINCDRGPT